ncbi:hypothetical protein [Porphyromonas macacae]|uniref:hypothetical protein n=1 Tax=Porphyromonas macacae TaxID=28115 RepID=UPI000A55920E|nr:hypothetical protein [Porphyromonas macacae]
MSKHLTDSERLRILEEYLVSSQSKYAIAKKYRIAQCLINDWLRKFGLEDKIPQDPMKTSPVAKSDLTLKEREESDVYVKRIVCSRPSSNAKKSVNLKWFLEKQYKFNHELNSPE